MRQEKTAILDEIRERLRASDCTIVISYGGLTVGELHELRSSLLPLGGRCLVAKNTLLGKAAGELGWADVSSMLRGQTAVVTAKGDASEIAKLVVKFVKAHKKAAVKGAALDGAALSAEEVEGLSSLPPKDTMRAMLLAQMLEPATRLVRVFIAPATGMLDVLKAKAAADEEKASAGAEPRP